MRRTLRSKISISSTIYCKRIKTMARLSCIVAIIGITLTCIIAQELYSDKYDNIDMKGILADEKLRLEYYDCFMDTGPCVTDDAKFLKGIIFEALATNCQKCTEKLKQNWADVSDWYQKNDPERWNKAMEKAKEEMKKINGGE